jgi:BirA family biotin operon repressor/biotin-[acetyl-CoA-carboxylase] ligase
VIGVGLNLTVAPEEFPAELRWPATSLFGSSEGGPGKGRRSNSGEAPATLPRTPFPAAEMLSRHLDRWVVADEKDVLAEWRRRDALQGREISWDDGSGVADGVDGRGNLLVVTAGGDRVALGAGEVHLRL